VLARYVGTYDFRFPENPTQPVIFAVVLSDGQLVADFLGDKRALIPFSETSFSDEGNLITFFMNDSGKVTHMTIQAAEGDLKAVKIK
jgi:hypothetical protein